MGFEYDDGRFGSYDQERDWAHEAGAECPESAWLLTPWDAWMRNPYYTGPPIQHPEDESFPLTWGDRWWSIRETVRYWVRRLRQGLRDDSILGPNDDEIPF